MARKLPTRAGFLLAATGKSAVAPLAAKDSQGLPVTYVWHLCLQALPVEAVRGDRPTVSSRRCRR
jgi:hypothetical protein